MSPMKRKSSHSLGGGKYDLCQTPPYALDPLLPYLRGRTVWEPAMGEGKIVRTLKEHGIPAYGSDILTGADFFSSRPAGGADCIVTNPPYSLKYRWLIRCYDLGLPFALLVPVEMLGASRAQVLFERFGAERLWLRRRINFKMPYKGYSGGGAQFPTVWLCWRLLDRDDVYGDVIQRPDEFEPAPPAGPQPDQRPAAPAAS